MDRPPRLVLVLDWDLDDATWRPAVADELRDRLIKLARGIGYEPVLDGPESAHVEHMIDRLAQGYRLVGDRPPGSETMLELSIKIKIEVAT